MGSRSSPAPSTMHRTQCQRTSWENSQNPCSNESFQTAVSVILPQAVHFHLPWTLTFSSQPNRPHWGGLTSATIAFHVSQCSSHFCQLTFSGWEGARFFKSFRRSLFGEFTDRGTILGC